MSENKILTEEEIEKVTGGTIARLHVTMGCYKCDYVTGGYMDRLKYYELLKGTTECPNCHKIEYRVMSSRWDFFD
jgi:Zn finger protein HypA/HybF involved in hydrogenase expression